MKNNEYAKKLRDELSSKEQLLDNWLEHYRYKTPTEEDIAFIEVEIELDYTDLMPFSFHIINKDNFVSELIEYDDAIKIEKQLQGLPLIKHSTTPEYFDDETEFITLNEMAKFFTKVWKKKTNNFNSSVFITTHDYMKWFSVDEESWTDTPLETDSDGAWIIKNNS